MQRYLATNSLIAKDAASRALLHNMLSELCAPAKTARTDFTNEL